MVIAQQKGAAKYGKPGVRLARDRQLPEETGDTMDVVQRAVEVASGKYSSELWLTMNPQERTAAIYAEIRRLDIEMITRQGRERDEK